MTEHLTRNDDETDIGTVLELEGNLALVSISSDSQCHACGHSCSSAACNSPKKVWADNSINSGIGDRVLLSSNSFKIIFQMSFVFVLPVIILLCCVIFLGDLMPQPASIGLGFLLAISYFIVGNLTFFKKIEKISSYKIIRVI
jgi:hypothetical protein